MVAQASLQALAPCLTAVLTGWSLSIGRPSLYAAIKRGELKPTKFSRKTLFLAADLAAFLTRLSQSNGSR